MTASRMKHSSKEQVKQATKAKSRKGGGGVPLLHNKKYITIEGRQDLNRYVIGCSAGLDLLPLLCLGTWKNCAVCAHASVYYLNGIAGVQIAVFKRERSRFQFQCLPYELINMSKKKKIISGTGMISNWTDIQTFSS